MKTKETELKKRMKACFPDLLEFKYIWRDIKEFFIQKGKAEERENELRFLKELHLIYIKEFEKGEEYQISLTQDTIIKKISELEEK